VDAPLQEASLKLKDFQDRFQRSILKGDDEILHHIPDGPRETKRNLLGVYRDAYVLRLIEVVGSDHEQLRNYLGEEAFNEMARAYIVSQPSHHPNARWFTRGIPEFLKANEPYSRHPIVGELASLEKALNDAFDGVDAPVLGMSDLAAIPPQEWGQLSFTPHPTATLIDAHTNVAAIWRALKEDGEPPPLTTSEEPTRIVVWRHELMPMFREMTAEEAMMWQEAVSGASFEKLCELIAFYDDAAGAPARAAGYLKGWLEAGLLNRMTRAG
jgi:hypothetical protein